MMLHARHSWTQYAKLCAAIFCCLVTFASSKTYADYENADVGVRVPLGAEWQLHTSRDTTPEMLKAMFAAEKGPNDSPLFLAIHEDQQLFSRLLIEAAQIKDLQQYARLIDRQLSSQGLVMRAARYFEAANTLQLEYMQEQTGILFVERVAIVEDKHILRLGFWTNRALLERARPEIERIFAATHLLNEQQWQPQWAALEQTAGAEIDGIADSEEAPTAAALACADPHSSLLWQVEGKHSKLHLFGSIHLGEASFYPLAEKIETSFRAADHVVFEVDPRILFDPATAARLQQQAMLPADETLSDHLSEAVLEQLRQTLAGFGMPLDNFMRFRPWFLTMLLTNLQASSQGYLPDYGVERYLLNEISDSAEILQLESLESQLAFLQQLDGDMFLSYTLANFEQGKYMLRELSQAWRCADKDKLNALFGEAFDAEAVEGMEQFREQLLVERNLHMVDRIEGYLESGRGDYFVVVGAAHYLGKGSIIELLREKGYTVKPVRL